jgi:tRNA dimethylallyltransferase
MYREFEIGTAKPSASERARVPHHLLDLVDPTGYITAGEYARLARQALAEIKSRENLPIVVGGTGLYLRALLDGLFPGPQRSEELRERLRQRVEQNGADYLYRVLRRLDPDAASKIHANDIPKLIRAIEVCLASRQKMTEMWKQGRDPLTGFRILRLGLNPDRDALYARINQRAERMFESGLVEETRGLLAKYGKAARPLASLGYKQAVQLLRGEIDPKTALENRAAGPSKLRQAPDDLVPARAGGSVARRFRGRLSNPAKGGGVGWRDVAGYVSTPAHSAASSFSAISSSLVTLFQFLPVPHVPSFFAIATHDSFGRATPLGK